MQLRARITVAVALTLCALPSARPQDAANAHAINLERDAVSRVRTVYASTDYVATLHEAEAQLKRFPRSRALAAWRAFSLARVSRPLDASRVADSLLAADSTDPWGWFAKSLVLAYAGPSQDEPAIRAASAEAYRRAPSQPSIVWARVATLTNDGAPAAALALLDSISAMRALTPDLIVLRGSALFEIGSDIRRGSKPLVDSAYATYAAARTADPSDVSAYTFPASRLLNAGRTSEALELLRKAVDEAPGSIAAHQSYWRALDTRKDRTQQDRNAQVRADMEGLLRAHGDDPAVLLAVASGMRAHGASDDATKTEDRLLALAPSSLPAEQVLVARYRALRPNPADTTPGHTEREGAYRAALWAFVSRPSHQYDVLLGEAYLHLFELTDSASNRDTTLRIVRGMAKYEGLNPHIAFAAGAIRLAEQGRYLAVAESLAHEGIGQGRKKIALQRGFYQTTGEYADAQDRMEAIMRDALGVVHEAQGRLSDAAKDWTQAYDLDHRNALVLFHLGRAAERRGALDSAEYYYRKGSLVSAISGNPTRPALRALYVRVHGSAEGYDVYLTGLSDADRESRRLVILSSRAAAPSAVQPFSLHALDGRVLSSDSLKGRIVVVNSWGIWCGPCVAEMPQLQQLVTKYANDSSVVIVTINTDANTDSVRAWMATKHFAFPTMLDDGYLLRAGVHSFPTTWFIGRDGRIAFTKTGWSENVVEEFGWRIEALRTGAARQ